MCNKNCQDYQIINYVREIKGHVHPQGLAVIFSHHQVCIKKKKGGHFWGVKSESRVSAPFFASKTV